LLCTTARAEGTGFEASLRVGYGIPLGDVEKNSKLSDGIGGEVPLIIDIGYRVIPNLFVGLYGQYAFGWVSGVFSDACDASSQISCSAHDMRLGVEGHFHFMPGEKLDPWVGLGIGYEWLGISASGRGAEASSTISGFEFVNLQAGLDIAVAEHFYVGPFVTLTIAQSSSVSVDCGSGQCGSQFEGNGDIKDKALHEWLLLGVRGAYAP
jgi:outer membrane protein W